MTWVIPARSFSCAVVLRTALASANKNLLGQLRKATGYSISHCKKALELHDNDIDEASKWLAAQAQAEGWAKATKLAGRVARQGQLGLSINKDNTQAAILELNCETDFVARNQLFVELVTDLTETCLATSSAVPQSNTSGAGIYKELWNMEQVREIKHADGKTLADKVALSIGLLGENMLLSRAMKMHSVGSDIQLYGYTHPPHSSNRTAGAQGTATFLGKYGAVVAVRSVADKPADAEVLKHLCLQVIGMNPECIGTAEDLEKYPEFAEQQKAEEGEAAAAPAQEDDAPVLKNKTSKDKFLLKQDWLNDEDYTVEQVLQEAGLEVLEFVRMEVGQCSNS
uniref:Elongation factor Ts, mitochondrial n=1 Tax=Hirondellea gigas TaxID=1518452 RepID=A0A2P2I0K3_9CRUS